MTNSTFRSFTEDSREAHMRCCYKATESDSATWCDACNSAFAEAKASLSFVKIFCTLVESLSQVFIPR
mgnify:CR=1 FL=1